MCSMICTIYYSTFMHNNNILNTGHKVQILGITTYKGRVHGMYDKLYHGCTIVVIPVDQSISKSPLRQRCTRVNGPGFNIDHGTRVTHLSWVSTLLTPPQACSPIV